MDWDSLTDDEIDALMLGQCVANINEVPTHSNGKPTYTVCGYTHGGYTVRVWRNGAEVVKMARFIGEHPDW